MRRWEMMVARCSREGIATRNIDGRRSDSKYNGKGIQMKSDKRAMYHVQIRNDCLPSRKENVRRYGRIAGWLFI